MHGGGIIGGMFTKLGEKLSGAFTKLVENRIKTCVYFDTKMLTSTHICRNFVHVRSKTAWMATFFAPKFTYLFIPFPHFLLFEGEGQRKRESFRLLVGSLLPGVCTAARAAPGQSWDRGLGPRLPHGRQQPKSSSRQQHLSGSASQGAGARSRSWVLNRWRAGVACGCPNS